MQNIKEIIVSKWQETLEALKTNLDSCGINDNYISSLTSYLYSAYKNKIPLILAGLNSIQLAKAISYIFNGNSISVIDCNNEIDITSANEVVIIKNFINSDKNVEIADLLIKKDKFYLIVVPHYEDLRLLPSSFFNYALPIILDFIVDKPFDDYIIYCVKAKNYIDYKVKQKISFKDKQNIEELMINLNISKLAQYNYLKLFSEAYSTNSSLTINTDLIIFLLSYANATNNKEIIENYYEENKSNYLLSIDYKKILDQYFYDF